MLKVTKVGASDGLILNEQKGDTFYLNEAPDGAMRLTPSGPEFERQMDLAETIDHV